MKRRTLVQAALAAGAPLAAPALVRAQARSNTLRFVPQADLASVDPVWSSANVTRTHAFLVYDTLYGIDAKFAATPQMAAGARVENGGRQWDITLRDGLRFHDGTPVLARDAVASLQRWGKRDPSYGQALFSVVDELSAPSDKVLRFRLKKPFRMLPEALAATQNMAAIMPERLAKTDPGQQITEVVGSGPFRFVSGERVAGSRVVYEKFAGYVPAAGTPSFTAGPKIAHLERVEWVVMPDPATAVSALNAGEVDWLEQPLIDLLPLIKQNRTNTLQVKDRMGNVMFMRFNQLHAPFNNPEIRRIVLSAVNQQEFSESIAGSDPSLIHVPVGLFAPGTVYASDAGLDQFKASTDMAAIKARLSAAGYKGERVVILSPADFPNLHTISQVAAELFKRMGFNVDFQSVDWGTLVQRRSSKEPVGNGGWSVFLSTAGGPGNINMVGNLAIRANGHGAWVGWPDAPKLEALRAGWFDAPDLAAQQALARQLQTQMLQDLPYIPLGMYYQPIATRGLSDIPDGFPQFYRVRKG